MTTHAEKPQRFQDGVSIAAVPSMNDIPNVRRTAPPPRGSFGRFALVVVALVALAAGAYQARNIFDGSRGAADAKGGKRGPQVVPVVGVAARTSDLPIFLDCLGTVTAFNSAVIRSRVDGELMKLHFREGQTVKEGELLAEIDPRPYEVQLAQAKGTLDKDLATLSNAKRNLERDRSLRQTNVISAQEYETSETAVRQAEGLVAADRAQVENAKLNLVYCRIVAPFTGRIGLRRVDVGNFIRASDLNGLLTIVQTQPIAVVFTVPQDAVAKVQRQQSIAPLKVEIHGREIGTPLAFGTVSAIDNQIDPASGTVRVKATIPNKDQSLFPNEFVSVRLLVETRKNVVVAPSAAVRHGPESDFVYVVKSDDTVELRPVKVGTVEGELALFDSGLADGERVVVQGLDRLQPGTKVEAKGPTGEKAVEKSGRRGKVGTVLGRGAKSPESKPPTDKSPAEKKP
jgi:membrane fusion protein, multidrug efflux system